MHDDPSFLKSIIFFFFFLLENNEWFLLVPERGDKAWPNAPSLRDEYMTLKNLNLINFFLESSDVGKSFWYKCTKYVWMPRFNKKNLFWVLNKVKNRSKECSKMQNRVNEPWWSWVSFGTWRVSFNTFRVLNGTLMRRLAYAMVGRLLMLFRRMFYVFKFFERYFLHLWPWNTFLLSYKLLKLI